MDVETYEKLQQRLKILEGIARGEHAIEQGRVLSHAEAKRRIAMAELIWTEPALNDLDTIADYIAMDKPGHGTPPGPALISTCGAAGRTSGEWFTAQRAS